MASKLIYIPSTSAALEAILIEARPGDLIQLLPIKYTGQFELEAPPPPPQFQPMHMNENRQVQELPPITIRGAKSHDFKRQTTIIPDEEGEDGIAFTIWGGKWVLSDFTIASNNRHNGVEIYSDGHILRNLTFNKNQQAVDIFEGNNNLLDNLTFNSCKDAVFVSGQGNIIQNCSFNRTTDYGIMLSTTDIGTVIENCVVRMKRNNVEGQEVIGTSLSAHGTAARVKNSNFFGKSFIVGNDSRFERCTLSHVSLSAVAKRTEFISSKIKKVYQRVLDETLANARNAGCKIGDVVTITE